MKVTLVNKVISRGGLILLALFVFWLANPSFKDAFSGDQADAYKQLALFGDVFQRV